MSNITVDRCCYGLIVMMMTHPLCGECRPLDRQRLIDERLIDIPLGSNLSDILFSSYNFPWLHPPSIFTYGPPTEVGAPAWRVLPYRRRGCDGPFYTAWFACVERFARFAGNAVLWTDRDRLIERLIFH